ncbi:hypothetical protein F511_21787 [Dorcoceras hygrometricum]|uniref:Uncharacterized protein n=1 Tax=Dorcoceras hygrometricum TaxID=472368 RepID=A0A2Z7DJ09_9LAMI|nr:hypothetical protein F511_21787 [Dorcoceras hygrometricum]
MRESRIQYLCDPQWFRDKASRGPTTIVAPESQFRTCPTDHDSIGYPRMSVSGESSTTMHRLLHASRSHPIPTPYDPKGYIIEENAIEEDNCELVAVRLSQKISKLHSAPAEGKMNRKTKQSTAIIEELSRESIAEF